MSRNVLKLNTIESIISIKLIRPTSALLLVKCFLLLLTVCIVCRNRMRNSEWETAFKCECNGTRKPENYYELLYSIHSHLMWSLSHACRSLAFDISLRWIRFKSVKLKRLILLINFFYIIFLTITQTAREKYFFILKIFSFWYRNNGELSQISCNRGFINLLALHEM